MSKEYRRGEPPASESLRRKRAIIAQKAAKVIGREDPKVEEVYLIGSVARGEDRVDSDIDLFVVREGVYGNGDLFVKFIRECYLLRNRLSRLRPFRGSSEVIQVSFVTKKSWADPVEYGLDYYKSVRESGVILFQRS